MIDAESALDRMHATLDTMLGAGSTEKQCIDRVQREGDRGNLGKQDRARLLDYIEHAFESAKQRISFRTGTRRSFKDTKAPTPA